MNKNIELRDAKLPGIIELKEPVGMAKFEQEFFKMIPGAVKNIIVFLILYYVYSYLLGKIGFELTLITLLIGVLMSLNALGKGLNEISKTAH